MSDHVMHSIVANGIHLWECSCGAQFLPNQEVEMKRHLQKASTGVTDTREEGE